MKSIVHKEAGESWKQYVIRLMQEAEVVVEEESPTDEEVRRFYKQWKDRKACNQEWQSPVDPDSHIAKVKNSISRLAYKAEHAVDLGSEFVFTATVHSGAVTDVKSLCDGLLITELNFQTAGVGEQIQEAVADKCYHSASTLGLCDALGCRTYTPKPERRNERTWTEKPANYQPFVCDNRQRD